MTPKELGLEYRQLTISDGAGPELIAWFLPARAPVRGTVIHFHGNAENMSTHIAGVYWLPARGFHLMMVDFRGYGGSSGAPEIRGVQEDALRTIRFARTEIPETAGHPLILFGQSLGGAVALTAAAQPEVRGAVQAVVAESPFSSYRGIVRRKLDQFLLTSWLRYPVGWTIPSEFDPIDRVDAIAPVPLLLIHPRGDTIVPYEESEALYERAGVPKCLWTVEQGEHIQTFRSEPARTQFVARLEAMLRRPVDLESYCPAGSEGAQ